RLRVEAVAEALDRGRLRGQVVQAPVALLDAYRRRGIVEPEVVADRVLRDVGDRRRPQVPADEDQSDHEPDCGPELPPGPDVRDHRCKVKGLGPKSEPSWRSRTRS